MPTSTYIALANITLSANEEDIVFSSIPNTYRDLVLIVEGTTSTNAGWTVRLNGSSSDMTRVGMIGDSGGASSFTDASNIIVEGSTSRFMAIVNIMDYATDKHKTMLARQSVAGTFVMATASRWAQTTAVDSVTVIRSGQSLQSGTTLALYGIVS